MNTSSDKNRKKEIAFYALIFIIVVVIAYLFPYTHDDWPWSGAEGMSRLTNLFKDYNGRWAGNILVMLLTRFRVLRAIVIATALSSIIYFIRKITKSSSTGLLIAILLTICMPISMLAQSIAWTSGFANYVPPTLLILFYINLNKNLFYNKKVTTKNRYTIPLLILGFVTSLFSEHMTIYNVVLSIAIVIYQIAKREKNLPNVFYMIGAIAGAVLMFSNGAYRSIMSATDAYRTIEKSNIFTSAIETYFNEMYKYLVYNNTVLNIVLCCCILVAVYDFYKQNQKKITKKIDCLLKGAVSIVIGFLTYIIYRRLMSGGNIFILDNYKNYLEGIIMIVFVIAIMIIAIIVCSNKARKKKNCL